MSIGKETASVQSKFTHRRIEILNDRMRSQGLLGRVENAYYFIHKKGMTQDKALRLFGLTIKEYNENVDKLINS